MKKSTQTNLLWGAAGLVAIIAAVLSYNAYFSPYNVCLRDALERGTQPLNAKIRCKDQHDG